MRGINGIEQRGEFWFRVEKAVDRRMRISGYHHDWDSQQSRFLNEVQSFRFQARVFQFLQRRPYKIAEKRMGAIGAGFEFGMELRAYHEGVILDFDDFHQFMVW